MHERDVPIKIRRISIRNYKGIDALDMQFPVPRLSDDPDIFVMGSRNGLGKTSIIECCALLLLGPILREEPFRLRDRYSIVDAPDLLIRAGERSAEIGGDIVLGDEAVTVKMSIDRRGMVELSGGKLFERMIEKRGIDPESDADDLIRAICGFTLNPVIENTFLLFHSYRKVQEGNPEMGMMLRGRNPRRPPRYERYEFPMSAFKLQILRSLMGQANLFELDEEEGSDETIDALNKLVKTYAGGTISKLRPSPDNTIDFRVNPVDLGESFTFDGLSSGQKEIISTLFLIWYHTRNRPSVVFIDEPELHLNAQWHRGFVKSLTSLAPQNQYIIATHSEDVMDSVSEDRRALLSSDQGTGG